MTILPGGWHKYDINLRMRIWKGHHVATRMMMVLVRKRELAKEEGNIETTTALLIQASYCLKTRRKNLFIVKPAYDHLEIPKGGEAGENESLMKAPRMSSD